MQQKLPPYKPPNLDFLNKAGPTSYVAGSMRNDKGFTLRPDMGPIDEASGKIDEHGLFFSGTSHRNEDDEEADQIYASIEKRLQRRKKRQDPTFNKAVSEGGLFGDIKPDLSRVTPEQWANLPDASDFRIKKLKRLGNYQDPKAKERFLPIPDNLIASSTAGYSFQQQIEEADEDNKDEVLLKAGEAREAALGLTLDSIEMNLRKQGKLTALNGDGISKQMSNTPIPVDPNKARSLLKNLLKSNPQLPSAWLASARVEESLGRIKTARSLLDQGCQECSYDPDLWIELIKLSGSSEKPKLIDEALESEAASLHDSLWLDLFAISKNSRRPN